MDQFYFGMCHFIVLLDGLIILWEATWMLKNDNRETMMRTWNCIGFSTLGNKLLNCWYSVSKYCCESKTCDLVGENAKYKSPAKKFSCKSMYCRQLTQWRQTLWSRWIRYQKNNNAKLYSTQKLKTTLLSNLEKYSSRDIPQIYGTANDIYVMTTSAKWPPPGTIDNSDIAGSNPAIPHLIFPHKNKTKNIPHDCPARQDYAKE